jgi:sterol desaturase/sphingolipid hydroxylase (fatty acid hydroxylase superfamily)
MSRITLPAWEREKYQQWAAVLCWAGAIIAGAWVALMFSDLAGRLAHRAWPRIYDDWVGLTLAHPAFYIGTAAILFLERLFPARRDQPLFSVGLAQDLVWLFLESLLRVTVLLAYTALLRAAYWRYLDVLTIDAVDRLPPWARIVLAILVIDFLGWFHHWVRHKVPAFWLFHTVHHSQEHLNAFTDLRYHVVEYAIASTVRLIPLMMLKITSPGIAGYVLVHQWYTRFTHANVRTNLGWLRFVLVTPQSHRVHHSPHRRHWDKNFGVLFSFWDRLLGTQYRNVREYPRTGIPNDDFPRERSARPISLLLTPIRQMIWPFKRLFDRGE